MALGPGKNRELRRKDNGESSSSALGSKGKPAGSAAEDAGSALGPGQRMQKIGRGFWREPAAPQRNACLSGRVFRDDSLGGLPVVLPESLGQGLRRSAGAGGKQTAIKGTAARPVQQTGFSAGAAGGNSSSAPGPGRRKPQGEETSV